MIVKQSDTNNKTTKQLDDQLDDLLAEVKNVNRDIDQTSEAIRKEMDKSEHHIHNTIGEVKKIISNANAIEKEAIDEFDALTLRQAEELAKEK